MPPTNRPRSINVAGAGVQIVEGQQRQAVLWPDLLADLTHVLERGLVGGAEAAILDDFLEYTENFFPGLGPYRTLGLCCGDEFRIGRRLRALLSEASGQEAPSGGSEPCVELPELQKMKWVGERAYLRLPPRGRRCRRARRIPRRQPRAGSGLLPSAGADGGPARTDRDAGVARRAQLPLRLWSGRSGVRLFARVGSKPSATSRYGKSASPAPAGLPEKSGQEAPRQLRSDEWPDFWDWLVDEQIADEQNREEFDRHFEGVRTSADPKPGLAIFRRWETADAVSLDGAGNLAGQISEALTMVLDALAK